ncbi:hypothetical protein [Halorubrum sp. CBA1229]|uniref:hypothetical protein n=1 Tax=Halorubrum sp. CBA1229 TaxID=1853699 RepID=UPI000F40126C|nr:hypothetical protein [Halorubrum sp. CBA1229]QKY16413.1 hypothetical protein Hrr1229_005795 [Halorubrum sp. CBA1229]
MHASEAGAALALQPEDEGEKTALSRLRDIYRRATQYRLPAPYWDEEPGRYCDLNPTGEDALVLRDGMGADTADGEAAEGARIDGEVRVHPCLEFDPLGVDVVEGRS